MTPYLVAHLVRGEPAFDIAIRLCEGEEQCQPDCGLFPGCKEEEWWIMPSTGHRCYPYWTFRLFPEQHEDGCISLMSITHRLGTVPPPPFDHPDFCGYDIGPASNPSAGLALLEQLGLAKPKQPINRRI